MQQVKNGGNTVRSSLLCSTGAVALGALAAGVAVGVALLSSDEALADCAINTSMNLSGAVTGTNGADSIVCDTGGG